MLRILLTAAVTPQSTDRLHLVDPTERRLQYVTSLRSWWAWAAPRRVRVTFAENSGEDLDQLAHDALGLVPSGLDLLALPVPPQGIVTRGKGASEALMMDAFAAAHPDDEGLWLKATGRLFVRNASRIVPDVGSSAAVVARLSLDLRHMDTRFFGASPAVWLRHLVGAASEVDEASGTRIEHVLCRRVLRSLGDGATLVRMRGQPAFVGRSGTWSRRRYDGTLADGRRLAADSVDALLRGPLRNKHF